MDVGHVVMGRRGHTVAVRCRTGKEVIVSP